MFDKPPLSIDAQIALLVRRGLHIAAGDNAAHHLAHISYYRLAGYWWPMYTAAKTDHLFKPDSRFSDVIALYNFDRELRLLVFGVIEKIEISLRTMLIYHLSHEAGPWWFADEALFNSKPDLTATLVGIKGEVARSKDAFIITHKNAHPDDGRLPPAWKTLELASFGTLSKLYGNLKPTVKSKDRIAYEYGTVNHTYLHSWLQSVAQMQAEPLWQD